MRLAIFVLIFLFGILLAIFLVQNSATILDVRLLSWHFPQVSAVVLIGLSAFMAVAFAGLVGLLEGLRLRLENRRLRRQVKQLDTQLLELRRVSVVPSDADATAELDAAL